MGKGQEATSYTSGAGVFTLTLLLSAMLLCVGNICSGTHLVPICTSDVQEQHKLCSLITLLLSALTLCVCGGAINRAAHQLSSPKEFQQFPCQIHLAVRFKPSNLAVFLWPRAGESAPIAQQYPSPL